MGLRAAFAVVALPLAVACAGAPPRSAGPGQAAPAHDGTLAGALEARMTIWVRRDGTRVYARHCRRASVDCRARIGTLARILERKADEHGLDPWLLAAIAVRESGLDPAALGARGEAGIVQLHPRGAGQRVRFVHDASYRERCMARVDACQAPVVERGAQVLSESIRRCGGVAAGLGRYASGRCNAELRYVERVLRERDRLRGRL